MEFLKDICLNYIQSNYAKYKENLKLLPIDLRCQINYHYFENTKINNPQKKINLLPFDLRYLTSYYYFNDTTIKKLKCTIAYDHVFRYYHGDILGLAHETSTYDLIISYLISIRNEYYLILYSGGSHCDYYWSDFVDWYKYNFAFFFDCNFDAKHQTRHVLNDSILVTQLYKTCYRINNNPFLENRLKWFDIKSILLK